MSGTAGSGAPASGAAGTASPGTASPAPGTGTPAPQPGSPALPRQPAGGERLSIREATRQIGEQRRAARGGQDGAPGDGEAQPRRRPGGRPPAASHAAAIGAGGEKSGEPAKPAAAPATQVADAAGDPLDKLMDTFRKKPGAAPDAAAAAPTGGAAAAEAPAADGAGDVTLTINGAAHNFTRAQLAQHVQQGIDYTQKSQRLAQYATEVQQAQAVIAEIAPLLIPEMEKQIRALEGSLGEEPDWEAMAASDPAKYNITRAKWDNAQRERARLQKLQTAHAQESDAQLRNRLTQGHKTLAEKLPGWSDPTMRGRIQSEMIKWGRANEFSDAELKNLYDPRQVMALCKAMMFDRMLTTARTDAPSVPVVQRGSAPPPAAIESVRTAEASFEAKPSVRNAAAFLSARRAAARGNGAGR
jgi:hypothetical protein